MKNIKAYWVVAGAIVLSVFIASSIGIIKSSLYYLVTNKDDISVTGSTSTNFTSDLIVWSASFFKKDMDLKAAYNQIKKDSETIKEFFISKGVSKKEITFKSIDINKEYKYKNRFNDEGDKVDSEKIFNGYLLTQEVELSSSNVDLVEKVSNEVTDLIEKDVIISSHAPKYYYTKLGE